MSDAREVTPIDATAVAGLSVRPLSGEAGSPMHPRGLRLHDGRVLPTWDWVAPPAGAGHSPGR